LLKPTLLRCARSASQTDGHRIRTTIEQGGFPGLSVMGVRLVVARAAREGRADNEPVHFPQECAALLAQGRR